VSVANNSGKSLVLNNLKLSTMALVIASFLSPIKANAEQIDSISTMLSNGKTDLSFRYRFEHVDQKGINKAANASTLKTRLSYQSAAYNGFGFRVEMDDVSVVGNENYNSVVNGKTDYPIVADPDGTDVNQAFVSYNNESLSSVLGRQQIKHSGQRFLSSTPWRQNSQTFDAISVSLPSNTMFTVNYSYISKVNRVFGPDGNAAQLATWDSNSHAFIASLTPSTQHTVSVFIYDFDFEDVAANSSTTFGVEYTGTIGLVSLAASYATQSDNANNPTKYSADYMSAVLSFNLAPVELSLGYELLGSDDSVAVFKTPLATFHKFQGWSNQLAATPTTGVEDIYVKVKHKIGAADLDLIYHQFNSDKGSLNYGSEINAAVTYPINKNVSTQLTYAAYDAKDFGTDTDKIWLTMNLKF
jgi:hypothetical protein